MKTVIIGIIAATALLAAADPASAERDPLAAWAERVGKQVDRSMAMPSGGRHGVAYVTVRRTADGRAELVRVDCDDRALARAARITVARLRKIPSPPSGYEGMPIRIQMLIGTPNDPFGYDAELRRLRAEAGERNRLASARVAGTQLASYQGR